MNDFGNTEELKKYMKEVWIKMLEELKCDKDYMALPDALKWTENVLTSNVPFGKQSRAMIIVEIYRHVTKNRSTEMDFRACAMGWIAEIFHTAALIGDDIMDGSVTRRGKPAWYLRPDVGMSAIYDVIQLEHLTWRLMRKYFHGTALYEKLHLTFQDIMFQTTLGQALDTRYSIHPDISKFTHNTYDKIVKYKTSIYTVYGPVAMGLIIGEVDMNLLDGVKELLLDIGRFAQIQDDYLDLYGDPKVTGKVGTDIIDGKCSWLIVEALERGTIEQKAILQESYGSKKIDDVNKIKEIYEALNLKSIYKKFETETYTRISKVIDTLEPETLRVPIQDLLLFRIFKK